MISIIQSYPVKHLERLPDLVLGVLVVSLDGHHHQELREVNHPRAVLHNSDLRDSYIYTHRMSYDLALPAHIFETFCLQFNVSQI